MFFKNWLCTNKFSSNLHMILIRNITSTNFVGIWGLGQQGVWCLLSEVWGLGSEVWRLWSGVCKILQIFFKQFTYDFNTKHRISIFCWDFGDWGNDAICQMLPSIFRILATLGAIQNRQILKILKICYVFLRPGHRCCSKMIIKLTELWMLPSIFRILATLGAIQNRQILKNLKILKILKISYDF